MHNSLCSKYNAYMLVYVFLSFLQIYEGHFFQDFRHGVGKYIWPNKCEFVGLFYANKKEGYGTSKFTNGNVFKVKFFFSCNYFNLLSRNKCMEAYL